MNAFNLSGRILTGSNVTSVGTTYMKETVRADPLNLLKKYRGGYNVTNDHYWSVSIGIAIAPTPFILTKMKS